MQRKPAQILGIDIGGTKTALAIVSFPEGRILTERVLPTPAGRASSVDFLATVVAAAEGLAQATQYQAIGIGICELVDRSGRIGSRHRVDWQDLPVQVHFERLAPTLIESDVRAAALAEAGWGVARDLPDFLFINVGTGISTSWVRDGEPHQGVNGHAIAFASSAFSCRCTQCGAGIAGIIEDIAGGAGLADRFRERTGGSIESAHAVVKLAAAGDKAASDLLGEASKALGSGIGMAVNLLDPGAIVLGGGLGAAPGLYQDWIVAETRAHIWSDVARELPILAARLGGSAGVIGAAAAAWKTQ